MAYTTIDKPSDYFNTALWTGTGAARNITDFGHDTDWVWIKSRANTYNHRLVDSVRGATKSLYSDSTSAESTESAGVTGFITDGVSLGGDTGVNFSGNYVGWSWVAGGTASSNTDGTLTTSVSANTTAGFSIATYTGNKTSGATIGHGLGVVPSMVIIKNRTAGTDHWLVYHKDIGNTKFLYFSLTNAELTSSQAWNNTTPDSSVVTLGNSDLVNGSSENLVAYCFAEKKGYSKFGSYTGNGDADGTFIYTGFKPAFIITKASTRTSAWLMYDNKRNTFNLTDKKLMPNENGAENNSIDPVGVTALTNNIDIVSNGFKQRTDTGYNNQSGQTYIYMAIAENPFTTSTGIPTTAR